MVLRARVRAWLPLDDLPEEIPGASTPPPVTNGTIIYMGLSPQKRELVQ